MNSCVCPNHHNLTIISCLPKSLGILLLNGNVHSTAEFKYISELQFSEFSGMAGQQELSYILFVGYK